MIPFTSEEKRPGMERRDGTGRIRSCPPDTPFPVAGLTATSIRVRVPSALSLAGALALLLSPGSGGGQEYHVDLEAENRVAFLSEAPLEDFAGVTRRIDGYVLVPPPEGGAPLEISGSRFYFEVDLASIDTGIGLRNRHMRDNYLETEDHPYATYAGTVTELAETPAGGLSVRVRGRLEIHGVVRERVIGCRASRDGPPGAGSPDERRSGPLSGVRALQLHCAFTVALQDHDIPIPSLMFMKIGEVMAVEVDFRMRLAPRGGSRT